MGNSLSLRIDSKPEEIYQVEDFIETLRNKFDLSEDVYGNMMICVTEAVNNAIKHGNKKDAAKSVTLNVHKRTNKLIMQVSDEGEGFDPAELPDPLASENLLKNSGRGVFIMKQMADDINYLNNGSTIELTFQL